MADCAEDRRGTERERRRERRERGTHNAAVCGLKWAYLGDTHPPPKARGKGHGYGRHGNFGGRAWLQCGGRGSSVRDSGRRGSCTRKVRVYICAYASSCTVKMSANSNA